MFSCSKKQSRRHGKDGEEEAMSSSSSSSSSSAAPAAKQLRVTACLPTSLCVHDECRRAPSPDEIYSSGRSEKLFYLKINF